MGYTSIKIAARKERARNGLLPIYLYFSQNRKRNKIALGEKVPEKSWIGEEQMLILTAKPLIFIFPNS